MHKLLIIALCFLAWLYYIFVFFLASILPERFNRKKNIKGKTVLITGAGSGLGRQLAIEFSRYSARLVLVDLNRDSMLETKRFLDYRRSSVFIYECDVSNYQNVYEMADKVRQEAGDIDILVNNAGIVYGKEFLDLSEENITKTIAVNMLAHFWTCKAFLPAMMDKNEGHLVTIASIAGKRGVPNLCDYSASKFGAVGFAESLELELRKKKLDGIKLTIVFPLFINTGMFSGAKASIADVLKVEDVAKQVVDGVLLNEDTIVIPRFIGRFYALRELIPRSLAHYLCEVTGNLYVMNNFKGRTQSESSK